MNNALLCACALAVAALPVSAVETSGFGPGLSIGLEENLNKICAVAIGRDDTLLVAADGRVRFFDPATGKCARSFPTGLTRADALATAGESIYLFVTRRETKEVERGNRKVKQSVPVGVTCKRFNWMGEAAADLELPDARSATSAKIVGNRLYLGDLAARTVRIYELPGGKPVGTLGRDLRLCCGILDFSVDATTGEVLVANLGAFKVQRYDAAGQILGEFGQRGASKVDFQGCCNPVSVAPVPGGNLVTVEKQPSRVKLYRANGELVQVFPDLDQLVEGCQQVSLAVDSKGRVYLGVNSKRHFVLQYVPQSS